MTQHPPRERIVYTAAQCLRRRGIAGTGLRSLVEQAQAPWGSLHHYFPGGKDQLTAEAVTWAGHLAGARVRDYLARADPPTSQGMVADLVQTWVEDLERHDFELGCPVVGAVADGVEPGSATDDACRQALDSWRAPLVEGLVATGTGEADALDLATTVLAAVEGAILMARTTRSSEPLRAIERTVRPLLRSA